MDYSDPQITQTLLTEHFQYTPLSLIDDIIDSVNNYIYQGINSLETGLFSTPPERLGFQKSSPIAATTGTSTTTDLVEPDNSDPYSTAKRELEEGLHSLETLLNSTVDKNFDKFEIYVLRNILTLPADLTPYVRLRHYEGITYPLPGTGISDAHEEKSAESSTDRIEKLRRELFTARSVGRHLSSEIDRNEAVLAQLRSMLAGDVTTNSARSTKTKTETWTPDLSFITTQPPFPATTTTSSRPLTTHVQFTLSQLPTLRSSLADLRMKLGNLKSAPLAQLGETARDEAREERRGYIETRTRGILERAGVGAGAGDSTGTDTEVGVPGKVRQEEEIEALEDIARNFKHES